MTVSSPKGLTRFQRQVLEAFFQREEHFFLTGGAALAGFHLHHRTTSDLDLFTLDPEALERGRRALRDTAAAVGASFRSVQNSPNFSRAVLETGDEGLVVDLVLDATPQRMPAKTRFGLIAVDLPEEILANKLTALVGRQEERDLVDVFFLEEAGFSVEEAMEAATAKDGGCTPANLAWLLSGFPLPPPERLPEGISRDQLGAWRDRLVIRLRRQALPAQPAP